MRVTPDGRYVCASSHVDNYAAVYDGFTFEQIADFCGLHPLEVKGIADEDVAKGIKGQDPVTSGQLTREQIEEAARLYASGPSLLWLGQGFQRQPRCGNGLLRLADRLKARILLSRCRIP